MPSTVYRPGQGTYARGSAAAAALVVAAFASWRLFTKLDAAASDNADGGFRLLGLSVPPAALWAGGLFVLVALIVVVVFFGLSTGLKGLDGKTQLLIDLLIDTQTELTKVSWPSREDLVRVTAAVLVSIALLGGFLFGVNFLLGGLWRVLFL